MSTTRKSYPSDASDAEWEFLIPYLTLMREDAPQRDYSLREVFDAVRYVVKTGCQWDFLPHDFPPWTAVYQQSRRWVFAPAPPLARQRQQLGQIAQILRNVATSWSCS